MTKEFQIARFNLLTAALNHATKSYLSNSYVYAWDKSVFPTFEDGPLARAFENDFRVTADMMSELLGVLDEAWDNGNGKGVTFYTLEERFEVRRGSTDWDRSKLIRAVRYIHLSSRESPIFDQDLFNKLINDFGAPAEANGLMGSYIREDDIILY